MKYPEENIGKILNDIYTKYWKNIPIEQRIIPRTDKWIRICKVHDHSNEETVYRVGKNIYRDTTEC